MSYRVYIIEFGKETRFAEAVHYRTAVAVFGALDLTDTQVAELRYASSIDSKFKVIARKGKKILNKQRGA